MEYHIQWTFGIQGYRLDSPTLRVSDIDDILLKYAEDGVLDKLVSLDVYDNQNKIVNVIDRDKKGNLVYNIAGVDIY